MNPDEFEQYLGLQGTGSGFDHQQFYYGTEPQRDRDFTEPELVQADEESQQSQPVVSAAMDGDHDDRSKHPSSIFDSFDQEEKQLVEQLTATERSSKP